MKIGHIFAHSATNTGDIFLKMAVQMSFHNIFPEAEFHNIEVRSILQEKDIRNLNEFDLLVIGGGGLLLRDTFPNDASDWQWGCSTELLKTISAPIIVYAIGYNRFRNQEDFNRDVFDDQMQTLIDKSLFFSVRNNGSRDALKDYLSEDQHQKIQLNFCPSILYPRNIIDRDRNSGIVGFMLAGDRVPMRHPDIPNFVKRVQNLLGRISDDHELHIIGHQPQDFWFMENIKGIPFKKVDLVGMKPKDVIAYYSKLDTIIGDRGHSQMIPFGLGCKIVSLISHNKLKWFLDDINMNEYGVEESDPDFPEKIVAILSETDNNYSDKRVEALRNISRIHFQNLNTIHEKVLSSL